MVPELLVLAVEYQRRPQDFRSLSNPEVPLPASFDALVSGLGSALSASQIEQTAAALGLSPAALRAAALFLVRHVLLAPNADHYRVLGLSPGAHPERVAEHYHLLVRFFHPDRLPPEERQWGGEITARLNAAYATLKDDETRDQYDRELRARRARGRRGQRHHRRPMTVRPSSRASVRTSSPGRVPRRRLGLLGLAVMVMLAAVFAVLASHPGVRLTSHVSGGAVHRGDEPRSVKPTRPIGGSRLGAVHMGHSPYRKFVGRTSVRQLCALGQPSAKKRHANGICSYLPRAGRVASRRRPANGAAAANR